MRDENINLLRDKLCFRDCWRTTSRGTLLKAKRELKGDEAYYYNGIPEHQIYRLRQEHFTTNAKKTVKQKGLKELFYSNVST